MIEVRCCCQPRKLLGWMKMEMPKSTYLTFPLSPKPGEFGFSVVTLPLATFAHLSTDGSADSYRCFKSEETPIEVLRRISCFVEADQDGRPQAAAPAP